MKKLFILLVFIFIAEFTFAEFQLESRFGYFFNFDTYKPDTKRSFNGLSFNIATRYFFIENIGLFFGINSNTWFNADNSDYVKIFETAGMKATIYKTIGTKLDLNFGPAFALPVNDKFRVQADVGLSLTVWGIEAITGNVTYMGRSMDIGIFIDRMTSPDFSGISVTPFIGVLSRY
jgi:hypothetical protein